MDDLISRQALCEYALNQKDKSITPNDIMRFPPTQPEGDREPEKDREFIKLTVRNSNGRPYYSIVYLEFDDDGVGNDFEGYSSYDLDVISDFLKEYFIPSAQPERKKGCWHDCCCSECGWSFEVESGFVGDPTHFQFCPNCGADMRGGQNERFNFKAVGDQRD